MVAFWHTETVARSYSLPGRPRRTLISLGHSNQGEPGSEAKPSASEASLNLKPAMYRSAQLNRAAEAVYKGGCDPAG